MREGLHGRGTVGRAGFQQVFGGSWITQGIWVAAELGIADLLVAVRAPPADLANTTPIAIRWPSRSSMRLQAWGFAQDAEDQFSLAPLSDSCERTGR